MNNHTEENPEAQARLTAAASFAMARGRENITFSYDEIADFIAGLSNKQWRRLQRLANDLVMTRDRIQ
jgi:hypothetical protein